jgi:type II secretion system protein N
MKRATTIIFYALYILGVTGIFAYILFPSDTVGQYLARQVQQQRPDLTLEMDRVRPDFPPGLRIEAPRIFKRGLNQPVLSATSLRVHPRIRTLLSDAPSFAFKGNVYGGELTGTATVNTEGGGRTLTQLVASLSALKVETVEILQQKLPRGRVEGTVNAALTYRRDEDGAETAEGGLNASDIRVEVTTPIIDVGTLTFQRITARMTMDGDRRIRIEECQLAGAQMNGELTGEITLRTPPERSALNLTGKVTPHPSFVASLGQAATMLLRSRGGRTSELSFQIRGTLENPAFSML